MGNHSIFELNPFAAIIHFFFHVAHNCIVLILVDSFAC